MTSRFWQSSSPTFIPRVATKISRNYSTEVEFGRWVAKRVQLSFPSQDVSRALALVVPLFPMANSAAEKLDHALYRPIFDRLATDGWIEKVSANASESPDTWVTAHDVLADQILLSYLRGIPYTTDTLVGELFSIAAEIGSLASTIFSLQRIADTPSLNAVNWSTVITNAISTSEPSWRGVRDVLIRTSLLSVPEHIALFHNHEALWANAEQEVIFQNSLGWFARWLLKSDEKTPDEQRETLISWIAKTVPHADKNNFVITWGLRLAPDAVKEAALHWIRNRPTVFQTHYVMVAWLKMGLPTQSIADSVRLWCRKFSQTFHLSFVASAWLFAGGDKALIKDPIKDWLVDHRPLPRRGSFTDAGLTPTVTSHLFRTRSKTGWSITKPMGTRGLFTRVGWLRAVTSHLFRTRSKTGWSITRPMRTRGLSTQLGWTLEEKRRWCRMQSTTGWSIIRARRMRSLFTELGLMLEVRER